MKCDDIQELLTPYLLGDLDETSAAEVREHLLSCEGCRAASRDIQPTLDLLRNALAATSVAGQRLSPSRRARIRGASSRGLRRVVFWGRESHPGLAAAAALLIVGFLLAGVLVNFGGRRKAALPRAVTVALPEAPPQMEKLEGSDTTAARDADLASVNWSGPAGAVSGLSQVPSKPASASAPADGVPEEAVKRQIVAGHAGASGKMGSEWGAWAETPAPAPTAEPSVPLFGNVPESGRLMKDAVTVSGGTRAELKAKGEEASGEKEEAPPASPQPAAFDTVGIVKSPVLGKGIAGTRSPGARGGRGQSDREEALLRPEAPAVMADEGMVIVVMPGEGAESGTAKKREVDRYSPRTDLSRRDELRRNAVEARERQVHEEAKPPAGPATTVKPALPDRNADVRNQLESTGIPETDVRNAPVADAISQISDDTRSLNARKADAPVALDLTVNGEDRSKAQPKSVQPAPPAPVVGALFARRRGAAGNNEQAAEPETGPRFRAFGVNPFVAAAEQPFSTFGMDVDTASCTLSRNYMLQGLLPPAEAVRTEEFVNFFDYGYAPPETGDFKIHAQWAPSAFGRGQHLLKIGVKARRPGREEQQPAALTFLIDTSGSMDKPDRLGLVRKSLRLLVDRLGPQDRVAIVQFDSQARLVLEPTPASESNRILKVVDSLQCGGSTHLEGGMHRAYELAAREFVPGAENRVLLVSDGVANLGMGSAQDILADVERFRKQGVYLSVFGFGMGSYDDEMLETLANKGNGTYTFVDSEAEARRVFVDGLAATLHTIAADAKIQVEFNPRAVARYRQIGYENRQLKTEDFRNDAVDAGEVGSGQSVTALYELELAGGSPKDAPGGDQLCVVSVRYRRTADATVEEIKRTVTRADRAARFEDADAGFRLAACVAEFAEILRGSPFAAGREFEDVARALRPVALELNLDPRVGELLRLVESAGGMSRAAVSE